MLREGGVSPLQNLKHLDRYIGFYEFYSVAMKCQWCGNMNFAMLQVSHGTTLSEVASKADSGSNIVLWRPEPSSAPELGAVPDLIRGPAQEVYQAKDTGAMRAAILMGRAVIEAIAKDHGVTEKISLETKIDKLHEKGIILASTAEDAHEVRHLVNDMAHGDFSTEATSEDADDVIAIMYDLIEQLYIGKARRERLREKREERKGKSV